MTGTDIEFAMRNKATCRDNAEIRQNVLYVLMGLFLHVFDWPEKRTGGRDWYTAYDTILSTNPKDCLSLPVRLPAWDTEQRIEDLVGEMPSKIVSLQAPHDVANAVVGLAHIELATPHAVLDRAEGRLFSVARSLNSNAELPRFLDPVEAVRSLVCADADRLRDHLNQSTASKAYAMSFRDAWANYRDSRGRPMPPDSIRHAGHGLAHALSGLLPTAIQTLRLYASLRERFGPEGLGLDEDEDRWYHLT